MTNTLLQFVLLVLMLSLFGILGSRTPQARIRLVALQGFILAVLLFLVHDPAEHIVHLSLLAVAIVLIKVIGFPWLLRRTSRKVYAATHTLALRSGHKYAMLFGILGLMFSLWLESRLPIAKTVYPPMLFPAAVATLLCGLIVVVERTRALGQAIGYLVLENGIFLLGMPLMGENSTWFELVLLLDVFVAALVMGVAIHHISTIFASIDVDRFCKLRD